MDAQYSGRTVVVGIDGSDSALDAVRWAAAESVRRGVPLRVVTAFDWNQEHPLGQVGLGSDYREIMLTAARRQLAQAVAVAGETAGVEVEQQLVVGFPIPVLAAESGRAQLVVLGDRWYGGVSGPRRTGRRWERSPATRSPRRRCGTPAGCDSARRPRRP